MNTSDKKRQIPVAPMPAAGVPGNLLSSVAPPTELPNFITASSVAAVTPVDVKTNVAITVSQPVPPTVLNSHAATDLLPEKQETFSPAIPPNKGEPMLPIRSPEDSQATQSPDSLPESTPDLDKIGDIMPGSGLITWMKGAVSTGGILQRVAEKAKNSVDSMITTLDPQMKEYLRSGGDLYVVVASDKEVKVSPIREAFQTVFGKATVVGHPAQSDVTAEQPVGYAAAYAAAKQRIAHIRSTYAEVTNNVPVVAVESFLQETVSDRWYEVCLVVVSQPSLGIELHVQSQGTAVPAAAVAALSAATAPDYPHRQTGYALTVGSVMAASLQSEALNTATAPDCPHRETGYVVTLGSIKAVRLQVSHTQWQEASTGVSRREILSLAARSLAGSYKNLLAVSAAET